MFGFLRRDPPPPAPPAPDPGLVAAGGVPRSPKWPAVRAAWLKDHPTCAACGRRDNPEVHHVKSFHEHPELELSPANFLTLCGDGCHITWGHLDDFQLINQTSREDAAAHLAKRQAAIAAHAAGKGA